MADRVRIGRFDKNLRFQPEMDVNSAPYAFVRDTLKFSPPEKSQIMANPERRYGGTWVMGETHQNGAVEVEWYIKDVAGRDATIQQAENLLAQLENASRGRYLEFRPDGATRSIYYELRGPGEWEPMYRWIEWQGTSTLHVRGVFATAPLPVGDYLDTSDSFETLFSNYTYDSGAAAQLQILDNELAPNGSLTTEKRVIDMSKGYALMDDAAQTKLIPGAALTNFKAGVVLRRSAANTYIDAYVDHDGTNSRLRIDVVIAGVRTNRGSSTPLPGLVAGEARYLRAIVAGNVIRLEYSDGVIIPGGGTGGTTIVTYALTQAEIAALPAGHAGFLFTPQHVNARIDSWARRPYTYTSLALPGALALPGIPGTAPALVDIHVSDSADGLGLPWALLAWSKEPKRWNRVWNGDFEVNTAGWATGIGSEGFNAATSITRVESISEGKFGAAYAEVVTPAALNSGATFKLVGPFKRGQPITAEVWVRAPSSTTQVALRIAKQTSDSAESAPVALTNQWQKLTVTLQPTSVSNYAFMRVGVITKAATATTMQIDGFRVYEGTTPPDTYPQLEGKGAYPTIGVLPAEANDSSDSSNFTLTTDNTASNGERMQWTPAGAGTAQLAWFIDPNAVPPDDFTLNDLRVEVWARIQLASTQVSPKLTLSARPEYGTAYGSERYTQEWGSQGQLVVTPSANGSFPSGVYRMVRLGTLNLTSDERNPTRWKLFLKAEVGPGSTGNFSVDHLLLVPARQRMANASGKPNDDSYPKFMVPLATNVTRIFRADGTGAAQRHNDPPYPAPSLGGQLPEFPPGDVRFLVTNSSRVPDDPGPDGGAVAANESPSLADAIHFSVQPRYLIGRGS